MERVFLLFVVLFGAANVKSKALPWMELQKATQIKANSFDQIFTSRFLAQKAIHHQPSIRGIETINFRSTFTLKYLDHDTTVLDLLPKLGLHKFLSYIELTGLNTLLNSSKVSLTLFVPTDAAFAAAADGWEKNVLNVISHQIVSQAIVSPNFKNDHVYETRANVNGKQQMRLRTNVYSYNSEKLITASGALVTHSDNLASNGVVHVVDRLNLHLPMKSIAKIVNASKEHQMLFGFLNSTGLVATLNNHSNAYTLLAPTDGAFVKLPKAILNKLHKDSALLKSVLLRHVLQGTYYSAGLVDDLSVTTASKEKLVWLKGPGGVTAYSNNTLSNVESADISATNGVLHSVDTVLYNTATMMKLIVY